MKQLISVVLAGCLGLGACSAEPPRSRLVLELLPPEDGARVRPAASLLELSVPRKEGRPGSVPEVTWVPLERNASGETVPASGQTPAVSAHAIWTDDGLLVDVDRSAADLGVRLIIGRREEGGWVGRWERITIAGPTPGGAVRVIFSEPE